MGKVVKFQTIDADLAKSYLSKMSKNRRVRRKHVDGLKAQMLAGFWTDSNDMICFNEDGKLINGQHRLTAVSETGKAQEFAVARGMPDRSFDSMDTGKKRTSSDILSIEGFPYAMEVSAIVRFTMAMETGRFSEGGLRVLHTTNHAILERAETEREKYSRLAINAKRLAYESGRLMPPSIFGGLQYYFELASKPKSDEFFEMLAYGTNLTRETPIFMLRRELTTWKQSTLRYRARDMTALTIKSWNAFYAGEEMKRLVWASKREPFPEMTNWRSIAAKVRHRQTSILVDNEQETVAAE